MDIKKIRAQFPALSQYYNDQPFVFFDGPGGSQVPQAVLDSLIKYLGFSNSNLGGAYFSSQKTTSLVADARLAAADLYNASSADEIIFGANATTIAFHMSRAVANTWQAGDEIIVTALDHYSNVSPWELLAKEKGVIVHHVPVVEADCSLDYQQLDSFLSEKTKLVALTYASNTTGTTVDMEACIKMIRSKSKALVYIDAVHYVPHFKVDVQKLDCDFLVSSAYKYFGPHIGVLFAKQQHQETLQPYKVAPAKDINPNRWETGTQSFEALAGYVATVNYLASLSGLDEKAPRLQRLDDAYTAINTWETQLSEYFLMRLNEYPQITLYGRPNIQGRTATFAIRIAGISPRSVTEFFAKKAFCIWDGNFYAQGLYDQLGLNDNGGVVRIGLMHYNSMEELALFFDTLDACIAAHR